MATDIQRARDVLAKWREKNDAEPWYFDGGETIWGGDDFSVATMTSFDSDARLIVGTAGNPDLLDAIDAMFATYLAAHSIGPTYRRDTERIAAAIIAADERMSA